MKKLTAEKCCQLLDSLNSNGMSILEGYYVEALEIALPILEQQERKDGLWEKMGMTEEDKYKIPPLPEEVTAQDMRETLNVLLHEEEAQAAASGFNQCLMECAPIYEAALRGYRRIDECLRELYGMQASLDAKHRSFVTERNRAAVAEEKLAVPEQQDHEKSIIAEQLEAVRDSLSLTPHQDAVISCAIDRLNVLTLRTLELSRSLIKQQEQPTNQNGEQ